MQEVSFDSKPSQDGEPEDQWSCKRSPDILAKCRCRRLVLTQNHLKMENQRTNGPVNAHLISWPSKAQNKQNLENIW